MFICLQLHLFAVIYHKGIEMQTINLDRPNRDIKLLAPQFYEMVDAVIIDLKSMGLDAGIYEGFRSLERQQHLWESGRSRPGPILTNAKPGQSAHNFGLGADIVGNVDGKWTWDVKRFDYKKMLEIYKSHGIKTLGFEMVHGEYTGPFKTTELADYDRIHGRQALWDAVFK